MMGAVPVITALDPSTSGGRLRMLRLAKDMTQQTLAKQARCSQSAIAKYENNQLVPSLRTQQALAEVLGTRRTYLYPDSV